MGGTHIRVNPDTEIRAHPTTNDRIWAVRKKPDENSGTGGGSGLGVDSTGGPVVDPTRNVLDLVQAAVARLDDMRDMEARHVRELLARDSSHAAEIRDLETKRLDAIRGVDVAAVQRAAEVQAQVALALQTQVAATAEAMRNQVAATNTSFANALAAAIKPLADAVAAVQQQQYIQAGQKAQVVESRDTRGEFRMNIGAIIGVVGLLLAVVTFILTRT